MTTLFPLAGEASLGALERRVSDDMTAAIARVPYYRDGHYAGLDVRRTLDFFLRRFVGQIGKFRTIERETLVADVGAGFGWLAIAFALATPARVVAVEMDAERLAAARRIAAIIGVADRIDWRPGRLGALPLGDREADVTYCIEVLEHTGRDVAAVRDLARVSADAIVLTTPNLHFPIVAHDTQLPFCHWLPRPARRAYARLCGRAEWEHGNLFWSSLALDRNLADFRIASRFLHYPGLADYLETYPIYLPYRGGGLRRRPAGAMAAYYRLASRFGRFSHHLLPSLAAVYRRRPVKPFPPGVADPL